jgi:hypothetical protein
VNVLFLIHGIGRHGTGWSGDPIAALDEAMKLYPECFAPGKKLADYVLPVEIRYDDIFDSVLERWKQLAGSLPAPAGAFKWTAEVTRLLKQAGDDGNLFARYGGDVLLYCGFALVARAARLRVNSVIASTMYRAHAEALGQPNPPKFAVLAHSMGTAVAQDALYQLATGNWLVERKQLEAALPDLVANANLSARQASDLAATLQGLREDPSRSIPVMLNALFLIADTSPLLHTAKALYSEWRNSWGAYDCAAVWAASHELDPVSIVGAGPAGTVARADKNPIAVRHFHRRNIHDFAHYLSHPAVHAEIFARMIPDFSGACYDKARALAASAAWTGFGGELAGAPDAAREQLKAALRRAVPLERSMQKLRETVENYFRAIGLVP